MFENNLINRQAQSLIMKLQKQNLRLDFLINFIYLFIFVNVIRLHFKHALLYLTPSVLRMAKLLVFLLAVAKELLHKHQYEPHHLVSGT